MFPDATVVHTAIDIVPEHRRDRIRHYFQCDVEGQTEVKDVKQSVDDGLEHHGGGVEVGSHARQWCFDPLDKSASIESIIRYTFFFCASNMG